MSLIILRSQKNPGFTITVPPSKDERTVHIDAYNYGHHVKLIIDADKDIHVLRDNAVKRSESK